MEEVEGLLEALNPRGHRESGLREALLQERDRLQLLLDGNATAMLVCQGNGQPQPSLPPPPGATMLTCHMATG